MPLNDVYRIDEIMSAILRTQITSEDFTIIPQSEYKKDKIQTGENAAISYLGADDNHCLLVCNRHGSVIPQYMAGDDTYFDSTTSIDLYAKDYAVLKNTSVLLFGIFRDNTGPDLGAPSISDIALSEITKIEYDGVIYTTSLQYDVRFI